MHVIGLSQPQMPIIQRNIVLHSESTSILSSLCFGIIIETDWLLEFCGFMQRHGVEYMAV
jgi:hypothetical protein